MRAVALGAAIVAASGWSAAASCDQRSFRVRGLKNVFLSGGHGRISPGGDAVMMGHNDFTSVVSSCEAPNNDPWHITPFVLLGATINFTVDLSRVSCGCNLAVYLVSAPARDWNGMPSKGRGDYYCDANQVGGQWCPEIDLMEANNGAFQSTPHKCDPPVGNHHYTNCDRSGCAQNTNRWGNAYGVGPGHTIDSSRPFVVSTTFEAEGATLVGFRTILLQEGRQVWLAHDNCNRGYLQQLSAPLAEGMSLIFSYWGGAPQQMAWLDSPPCGNQGCWGSAAGEGIISDLVVTNAINAKPMFSPPLPPQPSTTRPPPPPSPSLPQQSEAKSGAIVWRAHPEMCLSMGGHESGAHLVSTWCQDGEGKQMLHIDDGGVIRSQQYPNLCLYVQYGQNRNGAPAVFVECESISNLKAAAFSSPWNDDKFHWTVHPEMCLDVKGHSTQDQAHVQVWECIGGDFDQEFVWRSLPRIAPLPTQTTTTVSTTTSATVSTTTVSTTTPGPTSTTTTLPTSSAPPTTTTGFPAVTTTGTTTTGTTTTATTTTTTATTTTATTTTATTTSTTTSTIWFDCSDAASTWDPWTPKKYAWCCEHAKVGCQVAVVKKPFDCSFGFPAWLPTWSPEKVKWCCEHEKKACNEDVAKTTTLPPPKAQYKCHPAMPRRWSHEHREWCCQHEQIACEEQPTVVDDADDRPGGYTPLNEVPDALTYDCELGVRTWESRWTAAQAEWCCEHEGHGCAGPAARSGSAPPVYDCDKLFWDWKNSWSNEKKSFCCAHTHRGCQEPARGVAVGVPLAMAVALFCASCGIVVAWVFGLLPRPRAWRRMGLQLSAPSELP